MELNEIILNISGKEYTLGQKTFKKLPREVINIAINILSDGITETSKVYLERHADCFDCILWYFTHGELHMPLNVCPAIFDMEIKFWGIKPTELSKCCYLKYISYFEDQKLLTSFTGSDSDKNKRNEHQNEEKFSKWERIKFKGREILENPTSSVAAKIYVAISALVILTSMFVICASTHPNFQRDLTYPELKTYYEGNPTMLRNIEMAMTRDARSKGNISEGYIPNINSTMYAKGTQTSKNTILRSKYNVTSDINITANGSDTKYFQIVFLDNNPSKVISIFGFPSNMYVRYEYLDYIDIGTTVYFALELLFRFLFCSRKLRFFLDFLNIVDVIALLSEFVLLLVEYLIPQQKYDVDSPLGVLESIQILRVFRVFRILKNSIDFKILIYSLKESLYNMCIMTFLLAIATLIFASIEYYFERVTFTSIPDAMWWAVITMTTVGYGDRAPATIVGKLLGSACAVSGVFVLALLIPVLVNNFILFIGFSKIHAKQSNTETELKRETECKTTNEENGV